MYLKVVLFLCLCLYPYAAVRATDCVKVATSEGVVTLHHGDRACAALQANETDADKGKNFITCNNGALLFQSCAGTLRFDTVSGGCNWPQVSTCALSAAVPGATANPGSTQTPAPLILSSCDDTTCQMPNCFCYGATPKGIDQKDMPMFVMLTFDDALTANLYNDYYRHLVIDNTYNLLNPNGCEIKLAFYLSHENTDYTYVSTMAKAGNEIASHTIHHILAQGDKDTDYANITNEIDGLRTMVLTGTQNQTIADSIVGFRAPFLRVAGNVMYDVLRDKKFLYDTSIVNVEASQHHVPLWPFTLDFPITTCVNPPCPTLAYPGLWEVPLNGWIGDDGYSCGMIDACIVGENLFTANDTQWYNYYKRNFEDSFYPYKVPMHMFTHASMFPRNPHSWTGMHQWLKDMLNDHTDVWMVNPERVIEWMKNPLTHDQMVAQKWGC